jgi:DNA helicase II / ATP-dependent DNA helicase PcrA
VEVTEAQGGFGGYGGYGASRFDATTSFGSSYNTPGWQRAQAKRNRDGFSDDADDYYEADDGGGEDLSHLSPGARERAAGPSRGRSSEARPGEGDRPSAGGRNRRLPLTIEGELVAKSTGTISAFALGDRVFHQKFGNGNVTAIDGNKLTIQFDKAGEKRVVDSFVERV